MRDFADSTGLNHGEELLVDIDTGGRTTLAKVGEKRPADVEGTVNAKVQPSPKLRQKLQNNFAHHDAIFVTMAALCRTRSQLGRGRQQNPHT